MIMICRPPSIVGRKFKNGMMSVKTDIFSVLCAKIKQIAFYSTNFLSFLYSMYTYSKVFVNISIIEPLYKIYISSDFKFIFTKLLSLMALLMVLSYVLCSYFFYCSIAVGMMLI